MPQAPTPHSYRYTFLLRDRSRRAFEIRLDPETLGMIRPSRPEAPDWTKLGFRQCPNCPLDPAVVPRCPVADKIVDLIDFLREFQSFEEVTVFVESADRTYHKETTMQKGAASLIGMFMVTSGCPILDKLRPLVATHLPFTSPDEHTYRIVSMYVLAQFFRHRRGLAADWELKGLVQFLDATQTVNAAFCERLRAAHIQDAGLNAVIVLNTFSMMTHMSIEEESLDRLARMFEPYYV